MSKSTAAQVLVREEGIVVLVAAGAGAEVVQAQSDHAWDAEADRPHRRDLGVFQESPNSIAAFGVVLDLCRDLRPIHLRQYFQPHRTMNRPKTHGS